ncbi:MULTISPECIES: site-specific integrase [Rhodobacterales]|uniref:site-specific integrase n=1 Tax=Rhodobacterales TaxID=204455 RepID=UPI00215D8966|nr:MULTISPECIES: site-specific integrase [Rhodobacterales]MDO6590147.1 site-specific integrase [Yoonia sp. 1_MG-2023]
MARYLAVCGQLLKDHRVLARLRQDEIREYVQGYFARSYQRLSEVMNSKGLPPRNIEVMKEELAIHQDGLTGDDEMSDLYLDGPLIGKFREFAGLDEASWVENEADLRRELRKGRKDSLKAVIKAAERSECYSFGSQAGTPPSPPSMAPTGSTSLGDGVADFISEQSRQWAPKTTKQNQAYLNVMLEYFGKEKPLTDITKRDASALKKVLQAMPSSRNTKPALKDLPLMEAIKVEGHKKISPRTVNSHIQMFTSFFDWAERHGHAKEKLFVGMKVAKAKKSGDARKPFTQEQVNLIYTELVKNTSGLVRNESHKWGMLLGLYTGARLNEICQLDTADVQQEGAIWFLNITDEGDENTSIKSESGRRKVPLHRDLITLGFIDFVNKRKASTRLFPDYNYNQNGGYGRNLGRWCNESFLTKLGIKERGLVFHSFRHTVVTRLSQASVPEPVIQCIVGHARSGVTQEVYIKRDIP